jgi:hypothetical protein
MLIGVVASNEDESRFFAVSAPSEPLALSYVQEAMGSGYRVEIDSLVNLIQVQYSGLAELETTR